MTNILKSAVILVASLLSPSLVHASISYTLLDRQYELIAIPAGLGNENTPALVFGDDIEAAHPGATYQEDWIMWKYGPYGPDGTPDYKMVGLDEVLDVALGYWIIQAVAPSLEVTLPDDAIVAGDLPNGNNPGDTLSWVGGNPGSWIAVQPASVTNRESNLPPSLGVNYIIALEGIFPSRSLSEPFVGEVAMFAGNFAPRGWAFCDGQILAISQFSALFSILGAEFGGDGRTTFGLPDLRGRAPVHPGRGPGLADVRIGQRFGSESHLHTIPSF